MIQALQFDGEGRAVRAHEGTSCDTALLLAHLDAAYNLARWLGLNQPDAEDLVQDAYLRAFIYFSSFRGGDLRAWFLAIVRNCFYDRFKKSGGDRHSVFDESLHTGAPKTLNPESSLLAEERNELVRAVLKELPLGLREVLVLSEFEEMSYKEIAMVAGIPIGTVMSRLSRARRQVQQKLHLRVEAEKTDSLGQHQPVMAKKVWRTTRFNLTKCGAERGT